MACMRLPEGEIPFENHNMKTEDGASKDREREPWRKKERERERQRETEKQSPEISGRERE